MLTGLGQNPDPGSTKYRSEYQHFDLRLTATLSEWSGRLIVNWLPPEVGWFKWASKSAFRVHAITEGSLLVKRISHWKEVSLTCDALKVCPEAWKRPNFADGVELELHLRYRTGQKLTSALHTATRISGNAGQLYARRGGDAKKLKLSDPRNFAFTILK